MAKAEPAASGKWAKLTYGMVGKPRASNLEDSRLLAKAIHELAKAVDDLSERIDKLESSSSK